MARDNKDSRGEQLQQFSTIRKRKTTRSITDAAGYWRISAPVATTDRLGSRAYPASICPLSLITIDNLPAERAIRPFTISRKRSTLSLCYAKNSLHYSSEEGVEMAMTYLTIIETAKMWGLQVKEYLTYVWREVMSGNTDYESMTPEVVIAKQNS